MTGVFHSYMTPSGYTQRARAECVECNLNVPPAADSIIGQCEYYYRPLHCGYTEMVKKVTLESASEAVVYTVLDTYAQAFKTGAGTAKTWLGNRVQTPSAERDDLVDRSLHFLAER